MNIVIQKFGGSSLTTPLLRERAVQRVLEARSQGLRPVVVVSAMGRRGDPYATDTLLGILAPLEPGVTPRERDQLMACGEIIASAVMAATLRTRGCPARSFTGAQAGIITDETFGNARIIDVKPDALLACLAEGETPVVAGFQGVNGRGEVTTLGRGGSDTTAAALGRALGAVSVEIYTDVEGIMTADPRLVPEADLLPHLTYQEVAEMAYMGAKVIHPRAVEIARQARVPVRVLSTAGAGQGTLIDDAGHAGWDAGSLERVVAGIAHATGRIQVRVETGEEGGRGEQEAREGTPDAGEPVSLRVLRRLAREQISLDMIFFGPERLLFVVEEADGAATEKALQELGVPYRIRKGLAKVSAVGAGMYGVPGVMAQVLATLRERGVAVHQTADSQMTISCLVDEDDVETAVRALHRCFRLGSGAKGSPGGSFGAIPHVDGVTQEVGDAT